MRVKQTGITKEACRRFGAALLCLTLLPAAALAVTEGEVEAAPDIELSLEGFSAPEPADYLPDESYFIEEQLYALPVWGMQEECVPTQWDELGHIAQPYVGPGLTPGEAVRARKLLAAYQAGQATGDGASVLEAMEDVKIGVYALDPADFDGERVYTVLHCACLSDEELLAIIDAYAQLGLTFDPDALSYRNCMRGGLPRVARDMTQEEQERRETLANLIRRGLLSEEDVSGTKLRVVRLDWAYSQAYDHFVIFPYRRMTDEELALHEFATGVSAQEGAAFDGIEARAREVLCGRLKLPFSMVLDAVSTDASYPLRAHEENHLPAIDPLDWGTSRPAFFARFTLVSDAGFPVDVNAWFDEETGELAQLRFTEVNETRYYAQNAFEPYADRESLERAFDWGVDESVTQEIALASAKAYAEKMGYTDCAWRQMGEVTTPWGVPGWGKCWALCAEIGDGVWMDVYVGRDDARVHSVSYDAVEHFARVSGTPLAERWEDENDENE